MAIEPVAEVYKTIGDVQLPLHVFADPAGAVGPRAGIVFFFGGGWTGGSPQQFFPHCAYLASRGMVAISAEYRVKNRHDVTPPACIADGKSAIRWVRANAGRLGIAPDRIAAGGGSAGGHVAACTGTLTEFDEPDEDAAVSSAPNALVLFNPVADTSAEALPRMAERFGDRARDGSPVHHITKNTPPTIIFHGTADTTVPIEHVERFRDRMRELGNRCELVAFEGKAHAFFNYGRDDNVPYTETVRAMDRFLASLGWIEGEPGI